MKTRVAVLVWWVASGCTSATSTVPAAPADDAPSTPTRWVSARRADDTALLEAPAQVLAGPEGVAALSAPLQARVVRVRARPGQRVVAHEALVDVLMPELLHAAGDLAGEQIKVAAYGKRLAQLEELKREGLARLAEIAEVEAQLATARADAQAARATLRASSVSDAQAAALLIGDGVLSLRTPIAGLVTHVDATPGEVREPAGRPFAHIVGETEGRVEARLPSAPRAGLHFVFSSGAELVPVALISVSPRFEPSDGTRLAWFSADAGTLPIGASGRVRVSADPEWTVVPARAIALRDGLPQVRLRTAGQVSWARVEVVAQSGAEAVIIGLDAGTLVSAESAGAP